ncbi:hypothetical protein ACFY2W_04040 [Streptomyces sp. NPDC001262]|uniref:hypothetical protein n=1 Tax=Streptomyces sp. NPDC001262 TaxID=3364552 RepID=UPI0036A9CB5A
MTDTTCGEASPGPTHRTSPPLRLLPWPNADGKPCFLSSTGGSSSFVSRLADQMEAAQTNIADEALQDARAVLADPGANRNHLRVALSKVTGSLEDVLRVARSREARLPVSCDDADGGTAGLK